MAEPNKERRQRRAHEGLTRELEQTRDTFDSDASRGGSRGYPLWLQIDVVEKVQRLGFAAAAAAIKPSKQTTRRWINRIQPHEMNGGGSTY